METVSMSKFQKELLHLINKYDNDCSEPYDRILGELLRVTNSSFQYAVNAGIQLTQGNMQASLQRIENLLLFNNQKLNIVMNNLTELESQVQATTTAEESAIVLLNGLKAQLDAAGTDQKKLKELSDSLGSGATRLAAAVVANTPAEDQGSN